MTRGVRRAVLATAVATAAIVCSLAIAATSAVLPFTGDGNTIAGCYSSGGALKVRTPSEPICPKGYVPIEWNASGPAGTPGPAGPPGQPGAPGEVGASGADGVSVTSEPEPSGGNCANGGSKFTAANGVTYACNGRDGSGGGGMSSIEDLGGLACGVGGLQGTVQIAQTLLGGIDVACETVPPGCVSGGGGVLGVDAPVPLDFGNVNVGTPSMKFVQVTNDGGASITVSSVATAGSASFSAGGGALPTTLGSGFSITLDVTLRPQSPGLKAAQVVVRLADGRCFTHLAAGTGI